MTDILDSFDSGVLTLTMNRPAKKNALIPQMYAALAEHLEKANKSTDCSAIVIKGAGKDFTAGNDISVFSENSEQSMLETVRFMKALMKCQIPVIAQVQGNAVGIGTTMLLHCDFVICADNTRLMMPFINLGLVPEYASSYLLPRFSGYLSATKWLLLGKPFDAKEGQKQNLVTDVVETEQLDEVVQELCQQLTSKPRNALLQTKTLLKSDSEQVSKHMHVELEYFAKALQSTEAKAAFAAFLNR